MPSIVLTLHQSIFIEETSEETFVRDKFEDAQELRMNVNEWFQSKPPYFYSCAFDQLVKI